jgi:hypothetical protein
VSGAALVAVALALPCGPPLAARSPQAAKGPDEPGHALSFSDAASVELSGQTAVPLQKDFTLELWVRWFSRAPGEQYLAGDEAWPGMSPQVDARQESGCVLRTTEPKRGLRALEFTLGSTRGWFRVFGKPARDADAWVHVAVSKTKDGVWLYRNGKPDGYQKCTGVQFNASPTPLYLGVRKHAFANRKFYGDIRAFRLSSSALYGRAFQPPQVFAREKDTVILLDFSAGKGDRVPDLSGNGHDGVIAGAKWTESGKEGKP